MAPHPYAWRLDLDGMAVVLLLAVGYWLGWRRFRPVAPWRLACFACGLALVLLSHVSPLATVGNTYLLSAHLLQNVILAEWAPALMVAGLPPELARRLASLPGARLLTRPLVALPLWLLAYLAWHLPWPYDAALRHPSTLLHLEHACYFAAGVLLWWPVFQTRPHDLGPGAKAAYLALAFVLAGPLGLVLAFLSTPLYDFYAQGPGLWGLSPLADQQIAGASMSVEEAVLFAALGTRYLIRFLRQEEVGEALSAAGGAPSSGSP